MSICGSHIRDTIQYNTVRDLYGAAIRTVQERRTTVKTSRYARSNRTVLSLFLNVFVSVMSCKLASRLWSRRQDQSTGNHVRQTWCVFSAGHSELCRTIWVCTYYWMKRSSRHSYSDIAKPGRCGCSAWEGIICTRFVVWPVANAAPSVPVWHCHEWTEP